MLKKISLFLKKNWKYVLLFVGILLVTGALRKIIGTITLLWTNRASKATSSAIDYDFLAMTVYNDLHLSLFDWGQNRDAAAGVINSLASTAEFLELARHYAIKYNKDLRSQIKDQFTDKQYAELLWK